MLSSMTGFARADGHAKGIRWVWEIRSVNAKGLDIRCRLPQGLEALEPEIREKAQRKFRRGNIQIVLDMHQEASEDAVRINEPALERMILLAKKMSKKHKLATPSIEGLLGVRGVLDTASAEIDPKTEAARDARLLKGLDGALDELERSRRDEGKKLKRILEEQISKIARLAGDAKDNPARTSERIRARLKEQLERLLDSADGLDPDRLHQEAVMLATRSDIEEELDRIGSHIAAARDLLETDEPIGRKFEFLAQELNREANTLCSKAQDKSLTEIGLDLKAVIDQLREQVQNIE